MGSGHSEGFVNCVLPGFASPHLAASLGQVVEAPTQSQNFRNKEIQFGPMRHTWEYHRAA